MLKEPSRQVFALLSFQRDWRGRQRRAGGSWTTDEPGGGSVMLRSTARAEVRQLGVVLFDLRLWPVRDPGRDDLGL